MEYLQQEDCPDGYVKNNFGECEPTKQLIRELNGDYDEWDIIQGHVKIPPKFDAPTPKVLTEETYEEGSYIWLCRSKITGKYAFVVKGGLPFVYNIDKIEAVQTLKMLQEDLNKIINKLEEC